MDVINTRIQQRVVWCTLIASCIVVMLLLLVPVPMHAQEAGGSIKLTPLRSRPTLSPGSTGTGEITVTNQATDSNAVSITVQRFNTINEVYDYAFKDDPTTEWIRFTEVKATVDAGQKVTLPYSVAVPANASPGGYYFAIFASVEPHSSDTSLREVKRVASLVYLEVSGDVVKKGAVASFDLPHVSFDQNVPLSVRLANQGNTHFDADVRFAVGGTEQGGAAIKGLLLPGTVRRIDGSITLPRFPGIYKVTARYAGSDASSVTIAKTVVYIPVWSMVVTALLVGSILYGTIRRRRKAA